MEVERYVVGSRDLLVTFVEVKAKQDRSFLPSPQQPISCMCTQEHVDTSYLPLCIAQVCLFMSPPSTFIFSLPPQGVTKPAQMPLSIHILHFVTSVLLSVQYHFNWGFSSSCQ